MTHTMSTLTTTGRKRQQRNGRNVAVHAKGRASRALQELLNRKNENDAAPGDNDDDDEDTSSSYPTLTTSVSALVDPDAPLSILQYPHPALRAPNHTVTVFDDALAALADKMFDLMYEDDGVGLAAPQAGVNVRMMTYNETGERDHPEDQVVLVNPRIINTSGPKTVFEEGCLSFPQLYGDVVRPSRVRVKAQGLDGKSFYMNIDKFPARIFQHEFDHLQGVLFVDRMDDAALDGIREGLEGQEQAFARAQPGVAYERVKKVGAA